MRHAAKPIRSLWIGPEIGPYELASLISLARAGYDVALYSYDSISNLPPEIQRMDARGVLDERHVFDTPSSPGSFSAFSNLFRYRMLTQESSIWVDTDIFAGPAEMPEADYLFGYENKTTINGAVLGAPQESDFLRALIDHGFSAPRQSLRWGQIGPQLITQIAVQQDLARFAQRKEKFYPLYFSDIWKVFSPRRTETVTELVAESATIHLWNEVLRRASRPIKQALPHPGSFLGRAFVELGISYKGAEIVDPDWVEKFWKWESTWPSKTWHGLKKRVKLRPRMSMTRNPEV